jgi:hypothetical protein
MSELKSLIPGPRSDLQLFLDYLFMLKNKWGLWDYFAAAVLCRLLTPENRNSGARGGGRC